jgi:acyl-CoA hydrolase
MRYDSVERAADAIVEQTGGDIVLGMPLGMGKPNPLANALYRRAVDDPRISLVIATALSLTRPQGVGLQKRFLDPFVERVYGDYEELEYLHAQRAGELPDNIQVIEFFVQPASELNNPYAQQNYINTNYTHAARDMMLRGVNVLAQTLARRQGDNGEELSLSCNPEMTLDMMPMIEAARAKGKTILTVGQIHPDMPFMVNSALIEDEGLIDVLIDDPACNHRLISTPNMPVGMAEHFIGLGASALVKDGGTLQIGIGALGDAVAGALLLRHQDNATYSQLMEEAQLTNTFFDAIDETGPVGTFEKGLYGCSEMFTYGLFRLMEEGVIKREVEGPNGPVCMHGGFFLGPNAFYEGLRKLSPEQLARIDMTNISFVNALYGQEELKRQQRVGGRFVNTAFTVTLLGAGAADQLEDGRILSGVGGQYNFVAQAHELEGARSILLVRATRTKDGNTTSNILWNYGHTTIPRHLRDIVITEYGIADLRGKTDAEVIGAMLNICDSRFQQELMEHAKSVGKLPADHEIPRAFTNNTPQRLTAIYKKYKAQGLFPEFPLGSDFTYVEETLLKALAWLKNHADPTGLLEMAKTGLTDDATEQHFLPHLERMGYAEAEGVKDKIARQMILKALEATSE